MTRQQPKQMWNFVTTTVILMTSDDGWRWVASHELSGDGFSDLWTVEPGMNVTDFTGIVPSNTFLVTPYLPEVGWKPG